MRRTLGKSVAVTVLSAGLILTLSPVASAEPAPSPSASSGVQTLSDQVAAAQQRVTDAQRKSDDLEAQLGTVSDQHEVAKQKHLTDQAHLVEVRTELTAALAEAELAHDDLGQTVSSMYKGSSSQELGLAAETLATGDPQKMVDRTSYLRRIGRDTATVFQRAENEQSRVQRLEAEAAELESSSAKAEADLSAQLAQLTQLNTEAEAAFADASNALIAANVALSQAQQQAASDSERARLQAMQASLTASSGGSSSDYINWSNTGTSDWKGYLSVLEANKVASPSAAQLNNRAAWDPSWQPVLTASGAPQRGVAQLPTEAGPILILSSETIEAVNVAMTRIGIPYLWGGTGPRYDCSGLTMTSYRQAGVSIPRTSREQAASGESISMADALPGDLIYFGAPVHHVSIYLGDGMMLNAPRTGTLVRIEKVWREPVKVTRPSLEV